MRALTYQELLSLGYEILAAMVEVEFSGDKIKSLLDKTVIQWTIEDVKYKHYLFDLQQARDEAKAKG